MGFLTVLLITGTSEDPDINVKSNAAYGVSSGVGQSTDTDHVYSTVIIHEAGREEATAIQVFFYIAQITLTSRLDYIIFWFY